MDSFINAGFVDSFRHFHPEKVEYSYWSYRFKARERNTGWRIDYFLISESLIPKVKSVHAAHITAFSVTQEGSAFCWGCGGNDGRGGVERFINKAGDERPGVVDTMKCYMMNPHPVGHARATHWKGGPSLERHKVTMLACGRAHAVCIAHSLEEPQSKLSTCL